MRCLGIFIILNLIVVWVIVPTSVHISLTLYALKKMCDAIKEGEVRATFLNSLGQEVSEQS